MVQRYKVQSVLRKFILVLGICLLGVSLLLIKEEYNKRRIDTLCIKETYATLVDVERTYKPTGSTAFKPYKDKVTYTYNVDGKSYRIEITVRDCCDTYNDTITILYNPDNPSMHTYVLDEIYGDVWYNK